MALRRRSLSPDTLRSPTDLQLVGERHLIAVRDGHLIFHPMVPDLCPCCVHSIHRRMWETSHNPYAGSGNRTRKGLLPEVFETSASTNSAIPAYLMPTTSYRVHAVAANRLGDKPDDKQVPRKDLRV